MKFVLYVTLIWSILDSGWSNPITDKAGTTQIQGLSNELTSILQGGQAQIKVLSKEMQDLRIKIKALTDEMQERRNESQARLTQIQALTRKVEVLERENQKLRDNVTSNHNGSKPEGETNELETRLTAAETKIEGLQVTKAELDAKMKDLEEGGNGTERTIAFRAGMSYYDSYKIPTIYKGFTVKFNSVQLNTGSGYNKDTGIFTVPSGGEGYYYFATHYTVYNDPVHIDLKVNDDIVCTMYDDSSYTNTGCSAVVYLSEGDEVRNVYRKGDDTDPLIEYRPGVYNGFTGFRI